eukprot:4936421-Heterocapsa_arctica.AAC.1
MEKGEVEDASGSHWDSSTGNKSEESMETNRTEATFFVDNIILPTRYVEPTTSMEMKVHIEKLETAAESAMSYPTKRIQ